MFLEHLFFSAAIALFVGMIYAGKTGRDPSWIIIVSAYAPDIDKFLYPALKSMGITLLFQGHRIYHGDLHTLVALGIYAVAVAFLLHPIGIRFFDGFLFAAIGFAAHLFEDALVFNPAYPFLWPFSTEEFGIGIIDYTRDLYGVANTFVLIAGVILLIAAVLARTGVEGWGWIDRFLLFGREKADR
jgi:hypothetical protein